MAGRVTLAISSPRKEGRGPGEHGEQQEETMADDLLGVCTAPGDIFGSSVCLAAGSSE